MLTDPKSNGLAPATWSLLFSLYITQYLGLGFFLVALVAILRQHGESLERVSVIYLLALVWAAKFLWASLVDKISFGRFGHFKGWLLLMQVGMIATLLAIGAFDPVSDFPTVYALCLLLAFLSATQDIAVDGMACRLLPKESRGTGNSLQVVGGLLGNLLGAGGVLMAYPHVGWQGAMLLLAIGTGLSMVQLIGFKEPPHHSAPSPLGGVFRRIGSIWRAPGGGQWLAMLLLYPAGVSLAYALITPILVDAGWALDRIGLVVNVVGTLLGVPAALYTGWLIKRGGRRKTMIGAAALQVPGILALALPVLGYLDNLTVIVAVGLFFLFYNPVVVVIVTLMMDHASPESPATDYASQYSLYMLFSILSVMAGTALAGQVGYLPILVLSALSGVLMALLSLRYCHAPDGQSAVGPAMAPDLVPSFAALRGE
jgi:MFS family permease